ncbi:MAG: hypothetical protein OES13_05460 [Acidimicrobiia bacterium]|nr:hypothetical protein [Acidimicrobiia bacterium]
MATYRRATDEGDHVPENRYWTAGIAGVAAVAILLSIVLWFRLESVSQRLDETADAAARLGVQVAITDGAISSISGPLTAQLDPVVNELDEFATSVIAVPIDIDQPLPINTEISFTRTIEVPINAVIPIKETFDTTITVQGPLGIDVDVDVTVPIDVDVPIDLVVPINIDETIPINTTVPVKLSFPLELEVAGTPLADLAIALRDGLSQLADAFR